MLDKNINIGTIKYNGKYIALEDVSNPSNFGAVIRTAEAVGLDGVIVSGGCDIYNPKALRASMGSALRLSILTCDDAVGLIRELGSKGMLTLASTPDSSAELITEVPMNGGVVCVVGNEGNGVTDEVMSACTKRITIPMNGRAESLNASTAAAILIWEMVRK
jgi:TrmH family RNA methyltransferase